MRSFDSLLDRFCRKHPRFGIPRLMNYIVIGSALVYLLDLFSAYAFSDLICFSVSKILHGQIWRLVTFVFVPLSYQPFTLILSLYFYWMIGTTLEREWGSARFTIFYLIGVVLNALLGFVTGYATMSYVNLSMFFAFATLYPDARFLLFFIIPVKAKWMAWIDAAFFALSVLNYLVHGRFLMALIPIIAILNYLLFFSSDIARLFRRFKHKADPQTINFKKAQKKARETKGYIHKCAVCGITDADDPNMEFRYCSKCNGYYCYCMNHINNHVHIE
ncbi:MAG: rhomboid family intramembrane serine protease [Oscillospiraceae bacterium]